MKVPHWVRIKTRYQKNWRALINFRATKSKPIPSDNQTNGMFFITKSRFIAEAIIHVRFPEATHV